MSQTKGRQERRRKHGKRTNEKTQLRKVSANPTYQIPINVSRQNFQLQDVIRCGPGRQGGRPVLSYVGPCPWSPGPSVDGDVSPAWGQLSFRRGGLPQVPECCGPSCTSGFQQHGVCPCHHVLSLLPVQSRRVGSPM